MLLILRLASVVDNFYKPPILHFIRMSLEADIGELLRTEDDSMCQCWLGERVVKKDFLNVSMLTISMASLRPLLSWRAPEPVIRLAQLQLDCGSCQREGPRHHRCCTFGNKGAVPAQGGRATGCGVAAQKGLRLVHEEALVLV